jgi:hypothetical protein
LAEVIDIQLALYNYDWHYNLIEIKDVLEKVELMNYSKYLLEKVNPREKIKQGLQKGGKLAGERAEKVAEKVAGAADYVDQKKLEALNGRLASWREELKVLLEKNRTL